MTALYVGQVVFDRLPPGVRVGEVYEWSDGMKGEVLTAKRAADCRDAKCTVRLTEVPPSRADRG